MNSDSRNPAIPGALNVALLTLASASAAALLWTASHSRLWIAVAAAIAFSFVGNTLFALLHEAVHGVFHPRTVWNRWGGRLAAAWFPTGFQLQRAFHLTHHRNNRTELEQFDYIHPGDVKWLKFAQWYAILTGIYWLVAVLGAIVYALVPRTLHLGWLGDAESRAARQTSSSAYLEAASALPPWSSRLEILGAVAFQFGLAWALDLHLGGWALCYAAFGFNWSSLQYADHAFSPLDRHDGAWNLRVPPPVRALFLNYHHHLAHHRNPQVPWLYLGRYVDPTEPRPSFLSIWLSMWKGPRPYPGPPASTDEHAA